MIEFAVVCNELLVGQIGNMLRVTAGFCTVAVIREQQTIHCVFQNRISGSVCTLHFVENNTLVDRLLAFPQFIPPAFLAEDLRLVINRRMQDCIHIHIQQIVEVLVVAAAEGIYRLIRVGHGIQESINRGFQQLHKGLLYRILI